MQYSSTCQVAAAGAAAKNFNYFIFFEKKVLTGALHSDIINDVDGRTR